MKRTSAKLTPLAALIATMTLGLSGCGFTLIDKEPAPAIYDLHAPTKMEQAGDPVSWQLIVEEPSSVKALGTNRITLVREGNSVEYYKGARWTDRGPRLIQARIIEALEDSGRIASVGRETSGLNADVRLKMDLRKFQAVYDGAGAPTIEIEISGKLLDSRSRDIVATEIFTTAEVADSSRLNDIVRAYNKALGKTARKMALWTLATYRAEPSAIEENTDSDATSQSDQ